MDANKYQQLAKRTLIDQPGFAISDDEWRMIWGAIRLCAFAGAIAENVKKGVFHQHGVNMAALRSDLVNLQAVAVSLYQQEGYAGLPLDGNETMQIWNLIGLVGEAGEVARGFVEAYFAGHATIGPDSLTKELGDVLWYTSTLATKSEISLGDIMERNIDKLQKRYPDGYSPEASKRREEN